MKTIIILASFIFAIHSHESNLQNDIFDGGSQCCTVTQTVGEQDQDGYVSLSRTECAIGTSNEAYKTACDKASAAVQRTVMAILIGF
jgi:hypothetical protein